MQTTLGTNANNPTLYGGSSQDYIIGLAGNDQLYGYQSQDILSGGLGNDMLDGGLGADRLNGGPGNDVFFYNNFQEASQDIVIDFSLGDRLNFAKTTHHHFIGTQNFTGRAGEIRYSYQLPYLQGALPFTQGLDKTQVEIDSDGDSKEDVVVTLIGRANLVEAKAGTGILSLAADKEYIGNL
jgi:Ca2+-binding RTX toxin-like protein